MMVVISDFSLQLMGDSYSSKGKLVFRNIPVKTVLHGDTIEYQFACRHGYLIITHYDYFDAISYCFYYLNLNCKMLDVFYPTLDFGEDPYGFITDLNIIDDEQIEFGFFDDPRRWLLKIDQKPRWGFTNTFNCPPRLFFGKRYLRFQNIR